MGVAPRHSTIGSAPADAGEDARALAEVAGGAVAMVATLRRLRRQLRVSRFGDRTADSGAARRTTDDGASQKG